MIDPVVIYRVARWLYLRRIPKLPGLLQRLNFFMTTCDLPPSVELGQRVRFMHHGAGIIVHVSVRIGNDVMIMPHVVIGQNVHPGQAIPPLQKIVIGHGVALGAGSKIIASGYLEIGDGAAVGANAVVLQSVPAGYTAVGIPARLIPPRSERPPKAGASEPASAATEPASTAVPS